MSKIFVKYFKCFKCKKSLVCAVVVCFLVLQLAPFPTVWPVRRGDVLAHASLSSDRYLAFWHTACLWDFKVLDEYSFHLFLLAPSRPPGRVPLLVLFSGVVQGASCVQLFQDMNFNCFLVVGCKVSLVFPLKGFVFKACLY